MELRFTVIKIQLHTCTNSQIFICLSGFSFSKIYSPFISEFPKLGIGQSKIYYLVYIGFKILYILLEKQYLDNPRRRRQLHVKYYCLDVRVHVHTELYQSVLYSYKVYM